MDKTKEYADLEWSRKLGYLFPKFNYQWQIYKNNPRIEDNQLYYHEKLVPLINARKPSLNNSSAYIICTEVYPALFVMMLLERLPETYELYNELYDLYITKIKNNSGTTEWHAQYHLRKDLKVVSLFKIDESLPNALSMMLEWLIKEKLVEALDDTRRKI